MIVDHIASSAKYIGLGDRLSVALRYLGATDFVSLDIGRYDIAGDDIFALVNDYETKRVADSQLEAHRKYIDVQYMASGRECIGYAPFINQVATTPYNEEQDYALYQEESSLIRMEEGMFAIFFPGDLHMPGVDNVISSVRKIVVKVRL